MVQGTTNKGTVQIGTLNLGECDIVCGLDGTMTVHFDKGDISLDTLDGVFQNTPSVTVTEGEAVTEYESRTLQAYRVQADGKAEVSFLSNLVTEAFVETDESETVESEVTNE